MPAWAALPSNSASHTCPDVLMARALARSTRPSPPQGPGPMRHHLLHVPARVREDCRAAVRRRAAQREAADHLVRGCAATRRWRRHGTPTDHAGWSAWIQEGLYGPLMRAGAAGRQRRVLSRPRAAVQRRHYHAAVPTEQRERIQYEWSNDNIQVIVATIAFGMGINKPDGRRSRRPRMAGSWKRLQSGRGCEQRCTSLVCRCPPQCASSCTTRCLQAWRATTRRLEGWVPRLGVGRAAITAARRQRLRARWRRTATTARAALPLRRRTGLSHPQLSRVAPRPPAFRHDPALLLSCRAGVTASWRAACCFTRTRTPRGAVT